MANVLAVDDSVSLRKLVANTLAAAGHQVAEAGNGAEALEVIRTSGRTFNLIICDINMPVMDGLTFIKHVRVLGAHKFTPILVLTTEMDPSKKKSRQGFRCYGLAGQTIPTRATLGYDSKSSWLTPHRRTRPNRSTTAAALQIE